GAPGEDSDSGAVFVFRSEITPLCVGCVHTIKAKSAWTQGTVGQATIEAGDRFGASLAGVRSSAVMVGSPGEAPGSSPAGGMATHMDDGGLWAHLTEQSPWGAGIVASDEFGFGVSTAIDPWGFDVIAVSAHDYGQKASNGYGTGAVFLVERHPNGNYGATHTLP
ncbi:MAG: hypothetical protein KC636_19975, partial [Myxococcales bacterium]|nr:hypothetical protein [Myxococcales bacterium]